MASGLDEKVVAQKMKEMGIDTSDPEKGALLKATMAKLGKILTAKSTSEAILDDLHPKVRGRVEKLRELQEKYDDIEDQYLEEARQLVIKYEKLYQPLYDTRTQIVTGQQDGQIEAVYKEDEGEGEGDVEAEAEPAPKGVPEFWAYCLSNNDVIGSLITEKDMEVLRYLKDMKYELLGSMDNNNESAKKDKEEEEEEEGEEEEEEEEEQGFKLYFEFEENPHFSNKVLVKTYRMVDEEEGILEKSEGSQILWNPGKNVTVKVLRKKNKKSKSRGPPMTKTEKCESFFNFFSPPDPQELLGMDEEDEEDVDEEEMEALQDALQEDYEIGCIIKDKIIPHAVSWFTGEAIEDEEYDEEEEYDEDNEDGDEEGISMRAQSNSQANTSEASVPAEQPECKQQ